MFLECDKGRHCLLSSALPQNSSSISMSCIPAWAIAQMWLIRLVNANKQFMTGPSLADQSAFHLDIHDVHSQWDVSLGLMFFWSRTGYIPNWCIYTGQYSPWALHAIYKKKYINNPPNDSISGAPNHSRFIALCLLRPTAMTMQIRHCLQGHRVTTAWTLGAHCIYIYTGWNS